MSFKPPRPELIAIYRLEFYKKQKNWKLSSARKEKNAKKNEKKNLNLTYNIDHAQSTENSDRLNIAFVESDSDKTTQTKYSNMKNKELSQEWLEPVNIWPRAESSEDQQPNDTKEPRNISWTTQTDSKYDCILDTVKPKAVCTQKRLEELVKAAQSWELQNQDTVDQDCNLNTIMETNVDYDWNEQGDQEHWPLDTGALLSVGHISQDIWSQDPNVDVADGLDNEYIIGSDDYNQLGPVGDANWIQEDCCSWSVDSVGEFMRGADAAPHSSEIDLALPACVNTLDVSFTSLSRLSSSQLVLAARQHSNVLRRLLLESEQRQKLRSAASLNSFSGSSYEEFPTRDIGPYTPRNNDQSCHRNVFFKDVFVTGSYRNVGMETRGRGRGRTLERPFCL